MEIQMTNVNREWHEDHKMPRNANDDQRIAWHIEHSRNCTCRPIPDGVIKMMKEKGIETPNEKKAN